MSSQNQNNGSGSRASPRQGETSSARNPSTSITNYLHRHGYRLGKIIGEGSYSKVRLTTRYFSDGTPAYRLASKVINKKKASEDFVSKFLPRELAIVSRLDHPNIVRVYDVVEFDDHVYIFMDWCDKGDLLEYVKSKGFIPESKSHYYFCQLISAVQYLHNLDLSHRDLKCENILMGSQDQIRISDFGFARSCRDRHGKRILSNTYCGSAAYAAPEILQGTNYNPKLYDMWSLGCVLFIMLTGHMPYDESNIQKMLKHQLERTLTYPAHVYERISGEAKTCIRRLLEPDVTRRANIDQMIADEWVTKKPASRPSTASSSMGVTGDGDTSSGSRHNPSSRNAEPGASPRTPHGDQRPPSSSSSKKLTSRLQSPITSSRAGPPPPPPIVDRTLRHTSESKKLPTSKIPNPGPATGNGSYRPTSKGAPYSRGSGTSSGSVTRR